jgi:hypothetical protein
MTLISPFFKHWIVEVGDVIDVSYTDKPNFKKVQDIEYIGGEFRNEYSLIQRMDIAPSFVTPSFEIAKAKIENGGILPKDHNTASVVLVKFEGWCRMTYELALKQKIKTLNYIT